MSRDIAITAFIVSFVVFGLYVADKVAVRYHIHQEFQFIKRGQ